MVQVHCSRRRLLQRGLEFHVCIIHKSAHTKKVWKLIEGTSHIFIIWVTDVAYPHPKIYDQDMNMWKMFIGNPKIHETLMTPFFWFRYETFYYLFEFTVFQHNFLLCWLFHLSPPHAAHFVDPNWSHRGETKKSTTFI